MGRRKLTVWDQALKDAAKELDAPTNDFRVEKLATLTLLLKAQRASWTQGKLSNSGDMIEVMDAIAALRKEAGLGEGVRQINVHFVRTLKARCPHCGKMSAVSTEPFENSPHQTHPDPAIEAAARATVTPPPETPTTDHGRAIEPTPAPMRSPPRSCRCRSPSRLIGRA